MEWVIGLPFATLTACRGVASLGLLFPMRVEALCDYFLFLGEPLFALCEAGCLKIDLQLTKKLVDG